MGRIFHLLVAFVALASCFHFGKAEEEAEADLTEYEFQTEVNHMLSILIHNLYANREVCIRELISNSVDALEKIRFLAIEKPEELDSDKDLEVRVKYDTDANTLTIMDTGVGMTAEQLKDNLGTIARSGTAKLAEQLESGTTTNLIGQFGVGFYSAFLISDSITVASKSNDSPVQSIWKSDAAGRFFVGDDPRGNTMGRGTEITLHLKEDAAEFLDPNFLERQIVRYSQFMTYPIKLLKSHRVEPDPEDEDAEAETVWEYEVLNSAKPLWVKSPSDITDEEYNEFYQSLSKSEDLPLRHTHFKAEGNIEFTSLLYIPSKAPPQMYNNYYGHSQAMRLYVRRVLIRDDFEDFMPRYLSFIQGLVDSNDLPLNVNRDDLQQNKLLKIIGKKMTRKAINLLTEMADAGELDYDEVLDNEDSDESSEEEEEEILDPETVEQERLQSKDLYDQFWNEFGKSIKLGVIEDYKYRPQLFELLRFNTMNHPNQLISLKQYKYEMPEGQKLIYYISGESVAAVQASPFLDRLKARGFDVLFLVDTLDEYMIQNIPSYGGLNMQSITKEGLDLGYSEKEKRNREKHLEEVQDRFQGFCDWLHEIVGSSIAKVVVSDILESSPLVIPTSKYGWTANMKRIMETSAFSDPNAGHMHSNNILAVNYRHPIILALNDMYEAAPGDLLAKSYGRLLYDAALLSSGFNHPNPAEFVDRVYSSLKGALSVDPDAVVEPEVIPDYPESEEEESYDEEDSDEVIEIGGGEL